MNRRIITSILLLLAGWSIVSFCSCPVSDCVPQLNLCQIAGAVPVGTGVVNAVDWQPTPSGALLAAGISLGATGEVRIYSFDGVVLTLQSTIAIANPVRSLSWLEDSGNYYLAVGRTNVSTVSIYNATVPTAPTLIVSTNFPNPQGVQSLDWRRIPFDELGTRSYYLAIGRVSGGPNRGGIARFNITNSTLGLVVPYPPAIGGDGFSVRWQQYLGVSYLAIGVSGGGAPVSKVGNWTFTPPATLTGPANVPIEASATSQPRVDWFTFGGVPHIASFYGFGGTLRLKVSQFTPPSSFTNNPICAVSPVTVSTGTNDIDAFVIGGRQYIAVTSTGTGGNNSLLIYEYSQIAGIGQFCSAYRAPLNNAVSLRWVSIGGNTFLAVGGLLTSDCYSQNLRVFAVNFSAVPPIITSPTANQIICSNPVTVTGSAPGAPCGILELSIDGGAFSQVLNPIPTSLLFSFNLPALSSGPHSIALRSTVCSTTSASSTVSFTLQLDKPTPPVLTNAVACQFSPLPNTATITGHTIPLSQVNIYQNGSLLGMTMSAADGSFSFETGVLNQGSYFFTARVVDSCGRLSNPSNKKCVVIGQTSPIVLAVIEKYCSN